ncbi:MAG: hypothetical protein IKJ25_03565 [Clostridia bacterium]|nr:hypothetical protein [Clostridia bacterium]MBR3875838.1 hypothetical protein [Clostridia bacterium]
MKNYFKKSVGVLLILFILLSALSGCVNPEVNDGDHAGGENNSGGETNQGSEENGNGDNTEHTHFYEWVTDIEPTYTTPGVKHKECECGDKIEENTEIPTPNVPEELNADESELVAALIEYLDNTSVDYDIIGKSLADNINDIKSGKQPLHVVVDPSSYYFVCAYYEGEIKGEYATSFENATKYVWVKYETIGEITERYYDKNIITIFQINRTTYALDILNEQADAPFFEQFRMLRPLFENVTIITEPYTVKKMFQSFIYLNSSEKDEVYFSFQQWDSGLITIPCVYWEGRYYICVHTHSINHYENDKRVDRDNYYDFEEYYDDLMKIMITDKYKTENETQTTYYGLIEIDALIDVIRKGE